MGIKKTPRTDGSAGTKREHRRAGSRKSRPGIAPSFGGETLH